MIKINKLELFEKILRGEINPKNYKRKLSKSGFYKTYSRVLFYQKLTEPIKFMVLNMSQKEFFAVRNSMLKDDVKSKKQGKGFKGFSQGSRKLPQDKGEMNE